MSKFKWLAGKLGNKKFRETYVSRQLRAFLALQLRALRGEQSQAQFGKIVGKPQSVISRLENEGYGNVTVRTLIEMATKLDVALIVRFVDFPTFLKWTSDYSQASIAPASFTQQEVDLLVANRERVSEAAISWAQAVDGQRADMKQFSASTRFGAIREQSQLLAGHENSTDLKSALGAMAQMESSQNEARYH